MLGLFVLPGVVVAESQRVLVLDTDQAPFNLARHSTYLMETETFAPDWDDRLQLAELIALPDTVFSQVTTRKVGFGWTNAVVHVRTKLTNPSEQSQTWVLAFNQIAWGQNIVHLVIDGAPVSTTPLFQFPDVAPWQDQDRFLHVAFEMPAKASATLYVSYANNSSYAPMSIEHPDRYDTRRMFTELQIYILLGLVMGVTVLTVSLLGVLHQQVAVFYALYLTCSTFHLCYVLGLFTFVPLLSDYVYPIMRFWWAALALTFYLLFQRSFFATAPEISERLRQLLFVAAALVLITTFLHDFWGIPFALVIVWSSLCICLIAANGIVAIVKGITGRWFFAAGCFMLMIMSVPLNLSDFLTAHYTYEEASTVFLYGLVFEAVALSCAMFARVREIRAEREQALVAELKSTQEKLSMSKRLAEAAHDIQQPLMSMKLAVKDGDGQSEELGGAIAFLDEIVKKQLADDKAQHDGADVSTPEDEEFALNVVLDNLKPMFAAEAEERGLTFTVEPTDKTASANAFALMRILANLVSNAVKNTQTGSVVVACLTRETRNYIEIRDTGPGLSPEQLEKMTAHYERAGDYEGHGLGLAIVDQLCSENGFDLRVQSKPNQGTCFQIWLPAP